MIKNSHATNKVINRHRRSLAALSGIALVVSLAGLTAASTGTANAAVGSPYTTDFTGVTLSTVSNPNEWHMTGPYDAEVETLSDGNSALRMSNALVSGSFGDMIFSPTLAVPATETGPAHEFDATFTLLPVVLQPGLRVTISPDNGSGGRAGWLAIEHRSDGIALVTAGSYFNAGGVLDFKYQDIATGLDANVARTITMKLIKRVNTPKNSNNDTFSVQLKGKPAKTTTFEAYYQSTGEPNYATDTLLFRLSGTAAPQTLGAGLYVDDVSISTH